MVLRVPARVIEDSTYPAELDPIVGAELGIDAAVKGPAEYVQKRPAIAPLGTNQYFAAWRDYRSGEEMICGARIASDGTLVDTANACFPQWTAKFAIQPKLDDIAVACSATRCAVFAFVMEDATNTAVYGMRVDMTGVVPSALDATPVKIGPGSTVARRLAAASDGSSFMVPFRSDTAPPGTLGVGILPASGAPTYVGPVLDVFQYDDDVTIGFNGTNYVVVTATRADGRLLATRVSKTGQDLDATDKVLYSSPGFKAWSPYLSPAADRFAYVRQWTNPGAPYRIEAYSLDSSLNLAALLGVEDYSARLDAPRASPGRADPDRARQRAIRRCRGLHHVAGSGKRICGWNDGLRWHVAEGGAWSREPGGQARRSPGSPRRASEAVGAS